MSSWIIYLNLVLFLILILRLTLKSYDKFINYPNPLAKPVSNPEATSANNDYADILMYIQNNPPKSLRFIEDIKQKFFEDSCKIKDNIDFKNIARMPYGMPFS